MHPSGSVESPQRDGGLALLQRDQNHTQRSSSVIQQLNCNGCTLTVCSKTYSPRFASIHYPPGGTTARVLWGGIAPSLETLAEASADE
ncbi:hypothetical protein CgunFtcFv8_002530 [Champsocephalus gunnari]|uniref:Uncharacterized protein n=1 Tax=Champsocephalus gunnari TaxID=52237 RepID=A0AAN8HJK5_CHAGU|nr:hypothetical protein CgunFtcFv8_002530 [Champsocephalus gunnari]